MKSRDEVSNRLYTFDEVNTIIDLTYRRGIRDAPVKSNGILKHTIINTLVLSLFIAAIYVGAYSGVLN